MMDDAAFYACNSMVSDRFLLTTAFNLVFTQPLRAGPVIAEGRIRTANDVRQAFRAGAYAVVVGGAITGIDAVVRHFVDATPSGLAETRDA